MNDSSQEYYEGMYNTPDIDFKMQMMPPDWRYRWCENQACACMGCANRSGGLTLLGVTKKDHLEWMTKNPKPKILDYRQKFEK